MANTSKSSSLSAGAFKTAGVPASSPITWNAAVQMMNAYRQNCNHLYTYYQKEGSACVHKGILQGFRVKVAALQALIDGEYTSNEVPDEIFLTFGVAVECLGANPEDQGFTLMLAGIKFEDEEDTCGNILTMGDCPVLEYCDACPPKCPKNLAQHLAIFPDSLPCCEDCQQNAKCDDCTDEV